MKWKTEQYGTPLVGATRIKRKFAWLPKICDGGYTVWIETYDSHQVYTEIKMYSHLGKFITRRLKWVEVKADYLEVYI